MRITTPRAARSRRAGGSRRPRLWRLIAVPALLAASTAVTLPAHAAGPTVVEKVSASELRVTSAAGTGNDINVRRSPNATAIFVDDLAGVTAGSGCTKSGANSVVCSAQGVTMIRISTGDRNDRIRLNWNNPSVVLAGTGNDTIISTNGAGDARLNGGDGDDTISGALFDEVFGQNGNDTLRGGRLLSGGANNDDLRAFDGNQILNGNSGVDKLDGGAGNDDLCLEGETTVNCEAFSL